MRRRAYEVVELGDGEGAVPREGVEVGGDDAEGGGGVGVGVEKDGARRRRCGGTGLFRLGLAEDDAEPIQAYRRRRHLAAGRRRGAEAELWVWVGPLVARLLEVEGTIACGTGTQHVMSL